MRSRQAGGDCHLASKAAQRGAHPLIPQYVCETVPRRAVGIDRAVLQPDLHGIKRVAAATPGPSGAQSNSRLCCTLWSGTESQVLA